MYTALALSFRGPTIYERPISTWLGEGAINEDAKNSKNLGRALFVNMTSYRADPLL